MGMRFHHAFALAWIAEFIHQTQAGHRVFGVADGGAVLRRDFQPCKFIGEGRAADQQRDGDAGFTQVGSGNHHLLRAFHQ